MRTTEEPHRRPRPARRGHDVVGRVSRQTDHPRSSRLQRADPATRSLAIWRKRFASLSGGQMVIVENAGGAGGTIGSTKVARAKPDGYTLLVHHIGMATAPTLYRNLPYKVPEDFEMLGIINEAPSVLIGKTSLAANNFAELREWMAKNGKNVTLANAGLGSSSHLCGLLLQSALKISVTPVPYKGTGPAMTDLMGGQVDLMCEQATNATPQIDGKKVKVYGVTSLQRVQTPTLKNVPTLSEAGLERLQRANLACAICAERHAARDPREAERCVAHSTQDPELIKRRRGARRDYRQRRQAPAGRAQEVRGVGERPLREGHQGRGRVCRMR